MDLSFFNKHKVGWLLSRVESDTEQLKQLCSHVTARLFTDALVFVGIAVMLLISDFDVALPMVLVVFLLLAFVLRFLDWIRHIYDRLRSCYADLTGFISEYVQGIQIIQLYNREDDIEAELKDKSDALYDAQVKSNFYAYGFWAFFAFFTETVLIVIILYLGIGKYMAGTMSLGKLVMFIEFARQMTWPLHSLSENLNQIQRSFVAANRIFNLLDEKTGVPSNLCDDGGFHSPELIEFSNVSFCYGTKEAAARKLAEKSQDSPLVALVHEAHMSGDKDEKLEWALRGINFKIKKGEKIAIVGPSGSGKTTTANLLCRFYDPTGGSILIDGKELSELSPQVWRRSIGLVLQDICLFPGTVDDNLRALDPEISKDRIRAAAKELGAHKFIERFQNGYETELAERGVNLSQGERQLLSFTRALVFDPQIMILDEATSSIDRHTEMILQKALDKLLEGRTAVIIAHRLSTIRNADRILVFNEGTIVEDGSHDELIACNGLYKRLYSLQSKNEQVL
jgi:ATP-binding cassette subfamily B protein